MPSSVVNTVSKKCDLSLEEAEAKWKKAKKVAEKEGHKEDWPYIMEIFKHMVGKECMKKMNWANEEIKLKYKEYLSK